MSQEQIKQFIDESQASLASGQFQQALDLAEQAIALEENLTEAHVLRAISLSQLNRTDEATEAFRSAIMYGPYNPKAYFNLAVHYFQLGEKQKAEEMAKETMRIEPGHPGARQLLTTIENDRLSQSATAAAKPASYLGDPLSEQPAEGNPADPIPPAGPPQPQAPRPHTPIGDPPSKADRFAPMEGAPPGGQAPTPTGYYRPGYDTSSQHSIEFIGKNPKSWDTIGIVIGVGSFLITVLVWIFSFGAIMQLMNSPGGLQGGNNANMMAAMNAGGIGVQILSWVGILSTLIWMIMDLIDRRGNWLWIIPYIICCCCGFPGVLQLIYIWKGRQQ